MSKNEYLNNLSTNKLLNDNEINEDDNDTGNIINGFANCIDTINRIQTDEMMKDAMLLPDQIQMVNNFKEDQKNR